MFFSSDSLTPVDQSLVDYVVGLLDVLATIDTWETMRLGPGIKVSTEYEEHDWNVENNEQGFSLILITRL